MDNSVKFKDAKGRWRTQSLFLEQSYSSTSLEPPMYTLAAEDKGELPSFRRLYLELSDPTEYKAATQLLGGWEHWQALLKSKWFQAYVSVLREELAVKLRCEGLATLRHHMLNSDKPLGSAKYFADGEFKEKRGVGRPTKAEKQAALQEDLEVDRRLEEHAKRLGLAN